jgi:hypothetical protein
VSAPDDDDRRTIADSGTQDEAESVAGGGPGSRGPALSTGGRQEPGGVVPPYEGRKEKAARGAASGWAGPPDRSLTTIPRHPTRRTRREDVRRRRRTSSRPSTCPKAARSILASTSRRTSQASRRANAAELDHGKSRAADRRCRLFNFMITEKVRLYWLPDFCA